MSELLVYYEIMSILKAFKHNEDTISQKEHASLVNTEETDFSIDVVDIPKKGGHEAVTKKDTILGQVEFNNVQKAVELSLDNKCKKMITIFTNFQ